MMMPELRQDRSALRWIRSELDQTLREARNALEDFVEGQATRLDASIAALHHVHGALEMVQVYGGAMLADEMEQLAVAISQGQVKRNESAAEALMLGMVQLPAYLERIESGGADVPLALLPLLNDLRAAHDAPLVSETSLFAPKLNAVIAAETVRPGSGNRDMPHLLHQQRSHYHRGLLNWIRNHDVPGSLGQIRDVLDLLNSAAGTARFRRLLDAGQALAVVLIEDDEAPALAVKPLFGKLDRVFKQVIDQGEEAAMLDFPLELLKNLLYYIARSHSTNPSVVAVRQAADLVNSFPEDPAAGAAVGSLGGPDRELFAAVGDALAQDLRDVKDHLDLYMRSDRSAPERVTGLAQAIQRIGDTLGMVGRGDLRTRLKHRCDELRAAEASAEALPDDRLMTLAGDLLFVESSLSSLSASSELQDESDEPMEGGYSQSLSEGEMHQHFRAAVDEAMVDMAKTKDAILQFLDDPQNTAQLAEVPARLHAVAGVLRVLELPEPGRLLTRLTPYIAGLANAEQAMPEEAMRDALADVVIGAECYMQTAVEPGEDRERILAYADRALATLGLAELSEIEADSAALDSVTGTQGDMAAVVTFEPAEAAQPAMSATTGSVAEDLEAGGEGAVGGVMVPEAKSDLVPPVEPEVTAPSAETDVEDSDTIDSEIIEIFGEEADEERQVIQDTYPRWRDDLDDRESLATIRRSFHTLKGSGRMVGATNIGEFAWSIENLLNRVIEGTVSASVDVIQLLDDAVAVVPQLVEEACDPAVADSDVSAISARAFALAAGEVPAGTAAVADAVEEPASEAPLESRDAGLPEGLDLEPLSEPSPAFHRTDELEPAASPPDGLEPHVPLELPGELADVGFSESEVLNADSLAALGAFDSDAVSDSDLAQPSLNLPGLESPEPGTERPLEPGAGEADVTTVFEPGDESILTLAEAEDSAFSELDTAAVSSGDTSLNAVFLSETEGHLGVLADFIRRCRDQSAGCAFDDGIRRAMHTLRGSSRTAGMSAMAELAAALEDCSNVMASLGQRTDDRMVDLLDRSHQALTALAATIESPDQDQPEWAPLRDEIRAFVENLDQAAPDLEQPAGSLADEEPVDPELLEIFLEEAKELLEALEGELAGWESAAGDLRPVAQLQRTLHTMKGGARLSGIAALGDLSHALESVFESVTERRIEDSDRLKGLVRHAIDVLAQDVEQLSGGRMPQPRTVMVDRLEAAAHGREWDDIGASEAALTPEPKSAEVLPVEDVEPAFKSTSTFVEVAESDDLADTLFDAAGDSEMLAESQLLTDSELLGDSSFLLAEGASDDSAISDLVHDDSKTVHFPIGDQLVEEEGFVPRPPMPEQQPASSAAGERVRVPSESLDQMVNNAGEVSIYRARIEQQNSTFAFNLGELQQTIDRLRAQLRDLELETEAQILSRHEREGEGRADFDPLELDRYSTMQQLSRALSETVEDLSNLGVSLNDLSRDTDTLLLQQARVTTDLQDSLLRTRMVRFSSRVPRLERVVRQTSHSVGKQANLEVLGGEEDMDRAILERMMSPLEHLLRNAVSHGIEDSNTRLANDKAAHGIITLHLVREGSDVVLTLSDDGAGLDRARIREKAVERGLIEQDAAIDDDDLYQMILQPGFSTAQELSQVSGRGVGMDVVLTEVKQLGGTLEIDSQPGHGTSFTIRLPFTLAITDSLLVTLGDEIYAVPHSSMDGVVRVPVDELRAIYAGEQETFRAADRDYTVRYLGAMLGIQAPHIVEGVRWLPMLLVRSGEHRVAIQVDGLLGNRQIVVKSVGAQLSSVRWFTGGTILADGQIALILDVNSLVRMDSAQQPALLRESGGAETKGVSVMVVDDSITVRKVTSRLLERHNMQVVTAKDGVDAVTQLQEYRPDVMLLDIEMPRMDGYELARHMRSTPELSDIPIIMITSRSGDKHRNRALELGVKRYLGKPYQEADLLENIYTVLADTAL